MNLPRTDRTEPVLALTAAASALVAEPLSNAGGIWVLLDMAAVLAATAAVGMLLRALAAERSRPSLVEVATAVMTAGISGAVVLLALHGPQARVGTLLLGTAAGMGAVLTVLVLFGAGSRYLRERSADTGDAGVVAAAPGPGIGRIAGLVTVLAAAVAVAAVVRDAFVR